MARICGQVQDQKELAIETLMWVVYAERLLTCGELVHVLATEPDDSVFQDDKVPDIEGVLSACCGLLILEEKTSLVRLIHRTAQEYFKEDGRPWLPGAQTRLSKGCNIYLNFVKPVGNQTLSDKPLRASCLSFHSTIMPRYIGYSIRDCGRRRSPYKSS